MPPQDRSQMACHICGEVGHLKADCPQRGEGAPPPDTGTASCKICGMEKSRDEFSQNQWKKRKTSETGIACTLCADTMDRPPRRDGDEPRAKNPGRNVRCFNCGERGHISALCPLPRELGPRCYNCNEVGHISKDCPRERVAINLARRIRASLARPVPPQSIPCLAPNLRVRRSAHALHVM